MSKFYCAKEHWLLQIHYFLTNKTHLTNLSQIISGIICQSFIMPKNLGCSKFTTSCHTKHIESQPIIQKNFLWLTLGSVFLWLEHPTVHLKWFYGEARIEPANPGLQGIGLAPTPFWWFSWVVTSFARLVYDLCVDFMTGTPKGSPKAVLWRSWEPNLRPLMYKA